MFLDDSACNLSSLNLMKFVAENGEFDTESFRRAVDILITAQEIIVDNASYPTEKIAANSRKFRPLGLGYANLGALLMYNGLPYDSDAGRDYAACITALMTGEAYSMSARIAAETGPFPGFPINREPMLDVITMHRDAVKRINAVNVPAPLYQSARQAWDRALELGRLHGYRNSQATVLAPTGTIGFMMDCDTTGVEPDLALVKNKKLVGGGTLKIVNNTVPSALSKLGYSASQVQEIVEFIDSKGTIENSPFLKHEHLPVFDCAFKPVNGSRSIHYMGHLKMMAAVQPFISGAISKTVNLPADISSAEIMEIYVEAWRMGLKAVAIYRDGCKRSQPLSNGSSQPQKTAQQEFRPIRRKLPDERRSITHKFSIGGHEGYLTVGMYDDGKPGEIFLVMAKEGSTISGLMDAFATSISLALQYGVPLKVLTDKFSHSRFEPSGYTGNPEIPYAKSIMDYIFRWLASKFLSDEEKINLGVQLVGQKKSAPELKVQEEAPKFAGAAFQYQQDAPVCSDCGFIMVRNGACYKCENCGSTSGCS
jgi:ribonucleoside-diphosphate reductase alpha chain